VTSIRAVRRVNFGYFIRPAEETGTGQPRVEPVLGYLVRQAGRWLLFDTGIGVGYEDLDAHYRPVRRGLVPALAAAGVALEDIGWVANCHLHFDHSGGNPSLADRPIFVQESELATARERDDYTLPELVADDIGYQAVNGDVELFPGIFLLRTPGHVEGHQSLVVRCADGTPRRSPATCWPCRLGPTGRPSRSLPCRPGWEPWPDSIRRGWFSPTICRSGSPPIPGGRPPMSGLCRNSQTG
jgi:N-acyl homoserine lactone hydrolase